MAISIPLLPTHDHGLQDILLCSCSLFAASNATSLCYDLSCNAERRIREVSHFIQQKLVKWPGRQHFRPNLGRVTLTRTSCESTRACLVWRSRVPPWRLGKPRCTTNCSCLATTTSAPVTHVLLPEPPHEWSSLIMDVSLLHLVWSGDRLLNPPNMAKPCPRFPSFASTWLPPPVLQIPSGSLHRHEQQPVYIDFSSPFSSLVDVRELKLPSLQFTTSSLMLLFYNASVS